MYLWMEFNRMSASAFRLITFHSSYVEAFNINRSNQITIIDPEKVTRIQFNQNACNMNSVTVKNVTDGKSIGIFTILCIGYNLNSNPENTI